MADIRVTMSKDAIRAYIQVNLLPEDEYPDFQSLYGALAGKGIHAGLKKSTLYKMLERRIQGTPCLAAEGKAPIPGRDARLELLVDTSSRGKPLELENGSVDHRELQSIINVTRGTPLVRRVPPKKGIPGISVLGKSLPAPEPKDIALRAGDGVVVSGEDQNVLIASRSGALFIDASGTISVKGRKVISGDVDYGTGNVRFNGDLEISGTIKSGFGVRVQGLMVVKGSIEDAVVECGGDCRVNGGVIGGAQGKVSCGGAFHAAHGENCHIDAGGDVTFGGSCVHGNIRTGGAFRSEAIVGGKIEAVDGVFAGIIGGATETKTVLDIGKHADLFKQCIVKEKKLGHLATEIQKLKDELYTIVRNGMNAEGRLQAEDEESGLAVKMQIFDTQKEYNELFETVERYKAELMTKKPPVIQARELRPNTVICYGESQKTIKTVMNNLRVTVKDGKLVFAKI
ncbi:MAG: DUF342 domain-containing protein [Chitinispirillaceae bacterium]